MTIDVAAVRAQIDKFKDQKGEGVEGLNVPLAYAVAATAP